MAHGNRKTLLIIDDEKVFCDTVKDFLSSSTLEVLTAHTGAEGLRICLQRNVDVVLLDQKLPDGEGHDLAGPILERNEQTKIIFITAFPTFESAVKAVRTGAHDYLSKPFDPEELRLTVEHAVRTAELEKVEQVQTYTREKERDETVLIGGDGGLAEIVRTIESAALVDSPVLITGETGTGKNAVAKAIHYHSPTPRKAFISVNCAALPENLIEAELFGHEKGAFTGAVAMKRGVFEMAEGGTLFLDEIGDMPFHLQSKLLSVIEDKKIRRLGGETIRPVDVRIIAATGTELEKTLGKAFRKDLYYRLSVVRIHLPPLRERRQDIPALCAYLTKNIAGNRKVDLPDSEIANLMEYSWPGNVRELKNILERAIFLQRESVLRPSALLENPAGISGSASRADAVSGDIKTLEEIEKDHIARALQQFSGNYTKTAKALGTSLSTIKRKVREYGLK
jgi:DNA-binding NtrC family response regulator